METKIYFITNSKVVYYHETIHYIYNTLKHILLVNQISHSGMWEDTTLQCGYQEGGILGLSGRLATVVRYIAKPVVYL